MSREQSGAIDAAALAGTDAAAPKRLRAWSALCAWLTSRFIRQRGAIVPNVLQIGFRVVDASAACGSKVRAPFYVISDRFTENYAVRRAAPSTAQYVSCQGDELNFYQLAIAHSDGLSKDEVYSGVRDMLLRLGEAAAAGRTLRIEFGAGFFICADREVTFEFIGGASSTEGASATHTGEAPVDPMLGGRMSSDVAAGLQLAGSSNLPRGKDADAPRGSPTPSSVAGSAISAGSRHISRADEALYGEVDRLDPEQAARLADEAAFRASLLEPLQSLDLEDPTRKQIGNALCIDQDALGSHSIEQVEAALGARARDLEDQLAISRRETRALEMTLQQQQRDAPPRDAPPRAQTTRAAQERRTHAASGAAQRSKSRGGSAAATRGPSADADLGGGLTCVGAGSKPPSSATGAPRGRSKPHKAAPAASAVGSGGAPMLSVGFNSDGPAHCGHVAGPKHAYVAAGLHAGGGAAVSGWRSAEAVPAIVGAGSDTSASAPSLRGVRVAPPLPRWQPPLQPDTRDAAATAWRMHAAAEGPRQPRQAKGGGGARQARRHSTRQHTRQHRTA